MIFLKELLVQPRVLESWYGHKFWNLLVVKENHLCVLNDEHEVG
jgi:hypothetical protein